MRIECLAQELNVHNDPGLIQSPVWQSLGHHVFYRCSCTVIPHMQVPVFPSERLSHQNCFDSLPHSYFVGVPKFYGFHIHIQAALLIVFFLFPFSGPYCSLAFVYADIYLSDPKNKVKLPSSGAEV